MTYPAMLTSAQNTSRPIWRPRLRLHPPREPLKTERVEDRDEPARVARTERDRRQSESGGDQDDDHLDRGAGGIAQRDASRSCRSASSIVSVTYRCQSTVARRIPGRLLVRFSGSDKHRAEVYGVAPMYLMPPDRAILHVGAQAIGAGIRQVPHRSAPRTLHPQRPGGVDFTSIQNLGELHARGCLSEGKRPCSVLSAGRRENVTRVTSSGSRVMRSTPAHGPRHGDACAPRHRPVMPTEPHGPEDGHPPDPSRTPGYLHTYPNARTERGPS